MKKGTIVDSTIISAPSSSKNKERQRDPDAHSTKKGNTWHFGYKAHIGVDKDGGIVLSVEVTSANIHDVEVTPKLLTGEEYTVNGDSDISAQKSAKILSSRTNRAKRSSTKSTADRRNTRTNPIVPKGRSKEENTKNHPSEPKLNTYLLS